MSVLQFRGHSKLLCLDEEECWGGLKNGLWSQCAKLQVLAVQVTLHICA
jgi:hypothetical protein